MQKIRSGVERTLASWEGAEELLVLMTTELRILTTARDKRSNESQLMTKQFLSKHSCIRAYQAFLGLRRRASSRRTQCNYAHRLICVLYMETILDSRSIKICKRSLWSEFRVEKFYEIYGGKDNWDRQETMHNILDCNSHSTQSTSTNVHGFSLLIKGWIPFLFDYMYITVQSQRQTKRHRHCELNKEVHIKSN